MKQPEACRSRCFTSDAQASTIVTLELIRTTVLSVASGMFR